jgi:hypothetical protein
VLARAAALVLALVALALLPEAAGAVRGTWHAKLISASDGSNIRFSAIAEDGAAAGLKVLPDGTPQAVYFNGKRLKNFGSRLGPVSSFLSLNDRHQAAGYFSANPAARVTNLFGANPDPSIMPHAFFMSGPRTIKRLSVPSAAFAVNISGQVAGTFRASDGFLHAFLWRPLAKSGKRFIDAGVGDARALNDPSVRARRLRGSAHAAEMGYVGVNLAGGTSIWTVNAANNAVNRRVLQNDDIFLQSVSNTGIASGGEDNADGSVSPLVYDIVRNVVRRLGLPVGVPSGFAGGVARSGRLAGGSSTAGSVQHGRLWFFGGGSQDVNNLPGLSLPPGTEVTNVPAVSDTGLAAGFATTPTGQQEGVVIAPSPPTKLPLLLAAFEKYLDVHGYGGEGERVRRFKARLRDSLGHWRNNRRKLGCTDVKDAAQDLLDLTNANHKELDEELYDRGFGPDRRQEITEPTLGIEVRSALAEYGQELDCDGMKKLLGLA